MSCVDKIPEEKILKWLVKTCEGLKFMHSNHYIHRDIKLTNIMVDENGDITIIDFGSIFK